jgi:beta-glucanase (GH16 family)
MISSIGCDKDNTADFTADYSYEMIDDNNVRFTNTSSGEYSTMMWDFGNGQTETTTDKTKSYEVYYPEAGTFSSSLKLTNSEGETKSQTKSISITQDDPTISVSFTADIDPDNPNYVMLKNTTQGDYDSFKWLYRDLVVENEMEYNAYFPLAGDYQIQLVVSKKGQELIRKTLISIADDDPNYEPLLIWSDEFDYTGIPDPDNWNMETGGDGWGNNELQYYTNTGNNAMVENGILTITAREENYMGNSYTSARITTQNKFDFKYGVIEARIKLPYGQGIWPAFWMLGANFSSVGWPSCGEIDIMEMVGGDDGGNNTVYSTLHWDNNGSHADYGQHYTLSSGIFADDFHVFSIEWDEKSITAYVDDNKYFVIDIAPSGLSEFHNDFFIILNVAVGGLWPGPPDATTVFPQTMEVDYVRVYQK